MPSSVPRHAGGPQLHSPRDADDRREAAAGRARQYIRLPLLRLDRGHHRHGGADLAKVAAHVGRIKAHTDLPIAVGFGVKTKEQVAAIAELAEGVVVGRRSSGDRPKPR